MKKLMNTFLTTVAILGLFTASIEAGAGKKVADIARLMGRAVRTEGVSGRDTVQRMLRQPEFAGASRAAGSPYIPSSMYMPEVESGQESRIEEQGSFSQGIDYAQRRRDQQELLREAMPMARVVIEEEPVAARSSEAAAPQEIAHSIEELDKLLQEKRAELTKTQEEVENVGPFSWFKSWVAETPQVKYGRLMQEIANIQQIRDQKLSMQERAQAASSSGISLAQPTLFAEPSAGSRLQDIETEPIFDTGLPHPIEVKSRIEGGAQETAMDRLGDQIEERLQKLADQHEASLQHAEQESRRLNESEDVRLGRILYQEEKFKKAFSDLFTFYKEHAPASKEVFIERWNKIVPAAPKPASSKPTSTGQGGPAAQTVVKKTPAKPSAGHPAYITRPRPKPEDGGLSPAIGRSSRTYIHQQTYKDLKQVPKPERALLRKERYQAINRNLLDVARTQGASSVASAVRQAIAQPAVAPQALAPTQTAQSTALMPVVQQQQQTYAPSVPMAEAIQEFLRRSFQAPRRTAASMQLPTQQPKALMAQTQSTVQGLQPMQPAVEPSFVFSSGELNQAFLQDINEGNLLPALVIQYEPAERSMIVDAETGALVPVAQGEQQAGVLTIHARNNQGLIDTLTIDLSQISQEDARMINQFMQSMQIDEQQPFNMAFYNQQQDVFELNAPVEQSMALGASTSSQQAQLESTLIDRIVHILKEKDTVGISFEVQDQAGQSVAASSGALPEQQEAALPERAERERAKDWQEWQQRAKEASDRRRKGRASAATGDQIESDEQREKRIIEREARSLTLQAEQEVQKTPTTTVQAGPSEQVQIEQPSEAPQSTQQAQAASSSQGSSASSASLRRNILTTWRSAESATAPQAPQETEPTVPLQDLSLQSQPTATGTSLSEGGLTQQAAVNQAALNTGQSTWEMIQGIAGAFYNRLQDTYNYARELASYEAPSVGTSGTTTAPSSSEQQAGAGDTQASSSGATSSEQGRAGTGGAQVGASEAGSSESSASTETDPMREFIRQHGDDIRDSLDRAREISRDIMRNIRTVPRGIMHMFQAYNDQVAFVRKISNPALKARSQQMVDVLRERLYGVLNAAR